MTVSPTLLMSMEIASGICWTLVYILIIKRSIQDKTYGMPMWALCANISWEFLFSFVWRVKPPQSYVNLAWFAFDLTIVVLFLRFGRTEFRGTVLERWFYPMAALCFVVSFAAVFSITYQFEVVATPQEVDGRYAAFAQNLMMSVLFITMLVSRNSLKGQSFYIASLKMVGTLIPSILFFMLDSSNIFLDFLFVAIFVFDAIYVVLVYAKHRELNLNPWRRI
ncbi:MAG: transmembrane-type terpene cyclase [Aggregatilineales bacterium]